MSNLDIAILALKKIRSTNINEFGIAADDAIERIISNTLPFLEKVNQDDISKTEPLPIETAPRDGTYIILLAPSGYGGVKWRAEVGHYDKEYRPLQPWVNHAGDSFTDGGELPTHWIPLP